MKPKTKKVLKWTGIVLGSLVLIAVAFGLYINSIIPKSIGVPVVLQNQLFKKPQKDFPMEGKYIYKSASELAAMIRNGRATSLEIITEFLNHIKNNNYKYNALIFLRDQEALGEAKLADEAVAKGDTINKPLLGVPVTIKEVFWVKGSPSTWNAKMFGFIAPEDAPVVKQLKDAGAIILGTTNVPYMLAEYQTQGEVYPTASNPFDTTRTPGGSTGGGAAALAAGFTALELGSDLGGSIRVPSAFCGLYGLKTTVGAINITEGGTPDTTSTRFRYTALASGGPMARTADDLKLMWDALKNTKPDTRFQKPINWKPASNKTLNEYKLAWMDEWKYENRTVQISNDVKNKLHQLLDSLKSRNVSVSKEAPDDYAEMRKLFLASFGSMMSEGQPWLLRKLILMDMDDGSKDFEYFKEGMNDASDTKWQQLINERKKLTDQWETFFTAYDFFICPISYDVAFKKCPTETPVQTEHGHLSHSDYVPYSYIFNTTGHPCLVIPVGLNKKGMPIALQVVGPLYSEDELLHFVKLIEPLIPKFQRPN